MPKIDLASAPQATGSGYPSPFDEPCRARQWLRLGFAAGLTQFGVNLLTREPGAWSSQRHWHLRSDEFVYVLAGEVVLVTDDGEEVLHAGDCAGFRAGDKNGHHFQNRSTADVVLIEVGTRIPADSAHYSDIDMRTTGGKPGYQHEDGTPYPVQSRAT